MRENNLVVFTTETAVVVEDCMPRNDEQNGVALWSLSTSTTKTTSEHCFGVRFRASMPLLGKARTSLVASPSAAAVKRRMRMTEDIDKRVEMLLVLCANEEV